MTNHFLSPSHSKMYGKKPWYTCNKTSLWQTNFPSPLALYYVKVPLYWTGTQRMLQVTFDKLLDSPFNLPCTYVCASKLKRECDIGSGVLSWNCLDGGCCVVVNNCFILIGLNLSFATIHVESHSALRSLLDSIDSKLKEVQGNLTKGAAKEGSNRWGMAKSWSSILGKGVKHTKSTFDLYCRG